MYDRSWFESHIPHALFVGFQPGEVGFEFWPSGNEGNAAMTAPMQVFDDLHNLLGELEEKDGNFVEAANEYEIAAHGDPSESNLFDWGSELLVHGTLGPAIQVFQDAAQRYPASPRLAIGLGMALYAHGNYDEAVRSLIRAADLNPSDPHCYLFLSRAYDSSPGQADEVIQRFRRFSELQPRNAQALYYYAMRLWKGRRAQDPSLDLRQIETLLKNSLKSIRQAMIARRLRFTPGGGRIRTVGVFERMVRYAGLSRKEAERA